MTRMKRKEQEARQVYQKEALEWKQRCCCLFHDLLVPDCLVPHEQP